MPAVLAGFDAAGECDVALVLAADLPLVAAADLRRLVTGLGEHPQTGVVAAADHRGRANPLLAAYRGPHLRLAARRLASSGVPAWRLLPASPVVVDLGPRALVNVNRPADLSTASALLSAAAGP